jgi:hypothetical protein
MQPSARRGAIERTAERVMRDDIGDEINDDMGNLQKQASIVTPAATRVHHFSSERPRSWMSAGRLMTAGDHMSHHFGSG